MSWKRLSERIVNLPRASLNKEAPKRMSLAGAQHKMVALFDPETLQLREPLEGTPSTHILKPNSTAPGYPDSVVNEVFTMLLAGRLGLNVPAVWRLYVPEPVFIISRFDRAQAGQEVVRVHALDGIQMLNEHARNKYTSANLPKVKELIKKCRNRAQARLEVFRWIVFNTMVGNSDAHMKNISFLVDAEGVRLAPFYDLLCTAVYHTRTYDDVSPVWPREQLASPVLGAAFFEDVSFDKLVATGHELGLNRGTCAREVGRIVGKLGEAAQEIAARLESEMRDPLAPFGTPSATTMASDSRMLRAITKIVIPDMLMRVRVP